MNRAHGLKGAAAHTLIKRLPPEVITQCLLAHDLPRTGLLGRSRDTADLVTYVTEGPDEGLYVPAEGWVRQVVRRYDREMRERDVREVLTLMRDTAPLLSPSEDEDMVAVANGLFDVRTKEFHPFSPDVVLTSKIATSFSPQATTSPVIDGWDVDEWISSLATKPSAAPGTPPVVDPEVEHLLWEVIAALFRPGHAFDKAVVLFSDKDSNGKGTFLELLRALVGPSRYSSIGIADFGKDFLPENLMTTYCVLSDENEVGAFLRSSSVFKAWVTHDWVPLNRKHKDIVDVKGRGLCVFCLNELPTSKDKTESLYRRFTPVPFLARFVGSDENAAIKSDYVKRRDVLEYVLCKALMMPLFDRFSMPAASENLLQAIRVENDPVLQFAEEFLDELVWDLLPWKFLYGLYSAWMKKEMPMGRPVSSREFNKRLSAHVRATPECEWTITENALRTISHIVGPEPLSVEYDLSDWIDLRPIGDSVTKIGLPHNMPPTARGLVRVRAVGGVDEEQEEGEER